MASVPLKCGPALGGDRLLSLQLIWVWQSPADLDVVVSGTATDCHRTHQQVLSLVTLTAKEHSNKSFPL